MTNCYQCYVHSVCSVGNLVRPLSCINSPGKVCVVAFLPSKRLLYCWRLGCKGSEIIQHMLKYSLPCSVTSHFLRAVCVLGHIICCKTADVWSATQSPCSSFGLCCAALCHVIQPSLGDNVQELVFQYRLYRCQLLSQGCRANTERLSAPWGWSHRSQEKGRSLLSPCKLLLAPPLLASLFFNSSPESNSQARSVLSTPYGSLKVLSTWLCQLML